MRGRTHVGRRHELLLMSGLVLVTILTVSAPPARLVHLHPIERGSGLVLLVALVLTTFFSIHQRRRRQTARLEAIDARRAARSATDRADGLARLVAFGQALGGAIDQSAIAAVAGTHLPGLVGDRPVWVMTCARGQRSALGGDGLHADHERAARCALDGGPPDAGLACVPMYAGDEPIGVFGVTAPTPLTPQQRTVLTSAASMLAASLRHAELCRQLRDTTVRDALTGCFSRRHAVEVLDIELRRARRSRLPVSIVLFDLDAFTSINDRCGRLCGDAVLAMVGARMNDTLRGSDLKCRYDGGTFLILLPDTPLRGAHRVADALRRDLVEQRVEWNGAGVGVTASFGVAEMEAGEIHASELITRAHAALNRAKQDGRNLVRTDDDPSALSAAQSLIAV